MRGGVDPGEVGFRPQFVGVEVVWKDFRNVDRALSSSGAGRYPPRAALALRAAQSISDNPMLLLFSHHAGLCRPGRTIRPRFVGVEEIWNDFRNWDRALSPSGVSELPPPLAGLYPPRVALALRAAQTISDSPM